MLYIEIDLNKLITNIIKIKSITGKKIIPIIKSNAYGLGDIEIAKQLQKKGIDLMAVVDTREAMHLNAGNIDAEILILNSINPNQYNILNTTDNLIVSINSLYDAIAINNFALNRTVKIHIQIDTGMNRLGFSDLTEYMNAYRILAENPRLKIEGIYTHFTDDNNFRIQEKRFLRYLNNFHYKYVHCAASSTYQHTQIGNYLRIGNDIYGGSNVTEQIIKIITKPLAIRKVKKGETVGYDQAYRATSEQNIAVLPIGYYNGFRRSLAGYPVLINGKMYPTVGKVCMNHLFVKVDDDVNQDSLIVITSIQHPISKMAQYLNTVTHEILCMFNISDKRYIGG